MGCKHHASAAVRVPGSAVHEQDLVFFTGRENLYLFARFSVSCVYIYNFTLLSIGAGVRLGRIIDVMKKRYLMSEYGQGMLEA